MLKSETILNHRNLKKQLPENNRLASFKKWNPNISNHERNERRDESIESEEKRNNDLFFLDKRFNKKEFKQVPQTGEFIKPQNLNKSKTQFHNEAIMSRYGIEGKLLKQEKLYTNMNLEKDKKRFYFNNKDIHSKKKNETKNATSNHKSTQVQKPSNQDLNKINSRYRDKLQMELKG